uniref:Uncharacterized protein n=1 Tax=Rhizophora mucronata TaxID=61149 RepID=A0A2P2Q5Y7_RHIMU
MTGAFNSQVLCTITGVSDVLLPTCG